jgi:hypothetical protein
MSLSTFAANFEVGSSSSDCVTAQTLQVTSPINKTSKEYVLAKESVCFTKESTVCEYCGLSCKTSLQLQNHLVYEHQFMVVNGELYCLKDSKNSCEPSFNYGDTQIHISLIEKWSWELELNDVIIRSYMKYVYIYIL